MTARTGSFACRTMVAGLVAVVVLAAAAPVFAHRIEKRFPVDIRPLVTVRNKSGRVVIKSWDRPEVLVIASHVSEKTEVDADQSGNRIDVVTHLLSEEVTPADLRADYQISVPRETELQIRNDAGDVYVEYVAGDMTFDTVAADLQLQEVAGYLVIKTVAGSLVCVRCAGKIEVNSISGSIRLDRPISSSVRAQTYTGNIFFDGAFEPGGTYVLKNYSGVIEVRFSDTDSFSLQANSLYGRVESEAVVKPPVHYQHATPPRLAGSSQLGTFNQGHARVELFSFSGIIRVRRRN